MEIHGLNKTTLLDYPGHVAATVFTGGCNFRCPFCHNSGLVLDPGEYPVIAAKEVLSFLKKRKSVLSGVCITGGEPTLQGDLKSFLYEIKALGLLVKLDTNGYRPDVLKVLLEENLLDYVAMDVKASRERYAIAAGVRQLELEQIEESIQLLLQGRIDYEFRTTVVKGLHTVEEFDAIGDWLRGARVYFLQAYQDNDNVMCPGYSAFTKEEMETCASRAGKYLPNIIIRGLD